MKRILAVLFIAISQLSISQTNVISLRSHAGDMNDIDKETDNFGEPPWKMGVDTVVFVKKGVIVECGFNNRKDTIQSEIFTSELTDRIRDNYSPRCVFIGFKPSKHSNIDKNHESKKNGVSWIIAIVLGLILLRFKKNKLQLAKSFGVIMVFATMLYNNSITAQTNVISLKSHAGDFTDIQKETDNFGGPAIIRTVDTVIFVKKGCIVEVAKTDYYFQGENLTMFHDTLYSEIYDGYLTDRIKDNYSENCVFIGFKPSKNANIDSKHSSKKNGVSWIVAIILGLILIRLKKNKQQLAKSFGVIIVFASLLYSNSITAQTNVISLKSHAGNFTDLDKEADNFGNPPMSRYKDYQLRIEDIKIIDTVEFFRNGKVIRHFEDGFGLRSADTVANNNYTKYLTPYLKNQFPQNVVYIGFIKNEMESAKPFFAGMKRNGFPAVMLVLFILFVIPKIHRKIIS